MNSNTQKTNVDTPSSSKLIGTLLFLAFVGVLIWRVAIEFIGH